MVDVVMATDWIVIVVIFGILIACLIFDQWVRKQDQCSRSS